MIKASQWKIERLSDVYPGNKALFEHYWSLPERELAIVAGASIDCGLAECLAKRLVGKAKAIDKFLGVDGSAEAPCGSFHARTQLAYLLRVIPESELPFLDAIRWIRNKMAHRVEICFSDPLLKPKFDILTSEIRSRLPLVGGTAEQAESAASDLRFTFIYFGVVYQSMLHTISGEVHGVDAAIIRSG